jgi:hypothetical protein
MPRTAAFVAATKAQRHDWTTAKRSCSNIADVQGAENLHRLNALMASADPVPKLPQPEQLSQGCASFAMLCFSGAAKSHLHICNLAVASRIQTGKACGKCMFST